MKRHRRLLALVSGLLAIAALVVGAWSAAQFRAATLGRPWFVAPTGLSVGGDGTLYVAANDAEVQVYAQDGTPVRAWRLARPGPFRLHLEEGRVAIAYPASEQVDEFTRDGSALGTRRDPGAYARFAGEPQDVAATGAVYALTDAGVARTDPPPARVLVPLPPAPLAFFGAEPLLPVTFVLLSSLLGFALCLGFARRPEGSA